MSLRSGDLGLALAFLLALVFAADLHASEHSVKAMTDSLGPCLISIATPPSHGPRALIVAHGSRPEDTPLSADLDLDSPVLRSLLDQGWVVATTSYRRNGDILFDAVADVADLIEHLHSEYGIDDVVIEGWSLGAAVGVLAAEQNQEHLSGVLGVGGSFSQAMLEEDVIFTGSPSVPVLLMSNRSESAEALAYGDGPVWVVDRDGHCNVNAKEEGEAIQALAVWIDEDVLPLSRPAFLKIAQPVSAARMISGAAATTIRSVDPVFGNLQIGITKADLDQLGIMSGDTFLLKTADHSTTVLLATSYDDVPLGEWVAFIDADGWLIAARRMEHAANALGAVLGQEVRITLP